MKIKNKHFLFFCFLMLLVLAPAFYTYINSREYLDFFVLRRRVWEETAVIMMSILALIVIFFIKNITVSLIGTVFLAGACTVLEPVYSYTVIPPLMAIWCFSRAKEEKSLYYSVLLNTSVPVFVAAFVVLANNANDFIDYYYLHHKVFIIIFLSVFLTLNILSGVRFALGRKIKSTEKKQTNRKKNNSKKKSDNKNSEQLFLLFIFFIFIVLDVLTVIIRSKYDINYYLFSIIGSIYIALFIMWLSTKTTKKSTKNFFDN